MRGLLLDMAKGGFVPRLKADVYILSLPMDGRGLNSIGISHVRSISAVPQISIWQFFQGWDAVFLPAFLHKE